MCCAGSGFWRRLDTPGWTICCWAMKISLRMPNASFHTPTVTLISPQLHSLDALKVILYLRGALLTSGKCVNRLCPRLSTVLSSFRVLSCRWDPVFQPTPFTQTYAELDKQTKNSISHRYKALKLVQEYFTTQLEANSSNNSTPSTTSTLEANA
jgi:hypothetical protein